VRAVKLTGMWEARAMDIEAITARLEAISATTPWQRHGADVHAGGTMLLQGRDGSSEHRRQADLVAEFVANAPGDIEALLAAVRSLHGDRPSPPIGMA
jgi:hypothetical protein